MENKWSKFYQRKFSLRDYLSDLSLHSPLLEEILKENPKKILEVGIGTGSMSIFLSYLGYNVIGIDNDEEILERARELNEKMNGRAKFVYCDAFKLSEKFMKDEFDVVFSQGFFEHFNNKEIATLLKEQLKVGRVSIFSVPSNFYPRKDFGNERLLSSDDWKKILKEFNIMFIKYYGPQILGIKDLIKNFLKSPERPFLKPLHLLIKVRK